MNREDMSGYLWIIITIMIMACLLAFASPFGAYVKNNLEIFTGNIIEQQGEHVAPPTEEFNLKIRYDTSRAPGKTINDVNLTLKKYEQYSIASPEIAGYTPDIKTVEGTITEDTEIVVKYDKGSYTITYITNNGSWDARVLNGQGLLSTTYTTYTYGEEKILLKDPDIKRTGMYFDGWYDNAECSGSEITEITPTDYGNKTFYAKWTSTKYKITYIMNDTNGSYYYNAKEWASGSQGTWDSIVCDTAGNLLPQYTEYAYGYQFKLPATVSKLGYTFLGWSEEPDGDKVDGKFRTQITESDMGNKTFYAHWRRNTYTITYHTGFIRPNGEKVYYEITDTQYTVLSPRYNSSEMTEKTYSGYPLQYTYGDTIVLPSKFKLVGYDENNFNVGWYNLETSKITISAGGDNVGTILGIPEGNLHKTSVSPVIPGFTIGINDNGVFDHTNLNLYIVPTPNIYTITFDSNNEYMKNTVKASTICPVNQIVQSFLYDETKPLRNNTFTRVGYTFTGWNTKPDGSGTTYTNGQTINNELVSGNKTLYAQWIKNKYNIEYDLNRGDNETTKPSFATNGSYPTKAKFDISFNVTSPTRIGYDFIGWKVENVYADTAKYGATSSSITAKIDKDTITNVSGNTTYFINLHPSDSTGTGTVKLVAQWKAKTGSITYKGNQQNNETTEPIIDKNSPLSYTFDKSFYVPNPTRTGYVFTGWTINNCSTSVTHHVGQYEHKIKNHIISPNNTAFTGSTINTHQNGSGMYFINIGTGNETIEFIANWKPITGSITYKLNANNGSTSVTHRNSDTTFTFDKSINVTAPTRDGYDFVGWSFEGLSNDCLHYYGNTEYKVSGNKIVPDSTAFTSNTTTNATKFINLTTNSNITLVAQWKAKNYILYFDATGGSMSPSQIATTFDETYTIPSNKPTRIAWIFKGWYTGRNGSGSNYVVGSSYTWKFTSNQTLYADWKPEDPCYLGHTPVTYSQGATCIQGSYTKTICSVCKKLISSGNESSELGHQENGSCNYHGYSVEDGHRYQNKQCSKSRTGWHVPYSWGFNANHGRHTTCCSGNHDFTYYRHIHCGRKTTVSDGLNIRSGDYYYCGKNMSQKWCVQHHGNYYKVFFECNGSNDATRMG